MVLTKVALFENEIELKRIPTHKVCCQDELLQFERYLTKQTVPYSISFYMTLDVILSIHRNNAQLAVRLIPLCSDEVKLHVCTYLHVQKSN